MARQFKSGQLRNNLSLSGSFSGSFQGDGSNLTGITAEWDGSHFGDAFITGSLTISGSGVNLNVLGDISASAVSASTYYGDGSQLTGIDSSSYASTASYVETSQTASYVLNAVSSSYASTSSYAFYAVSASHEIIKEVSSSYADTASFAQSGDGIFSGSFSGSFEGNGSGLTNIPASGITGLNLSQIASGSATASISPNGGLYVNTNLTASGNISASGIITSISSSHDYIYPANNDSEAIIIDGKDGGVWIKCVDGVDNSGVTLESELVSLEINNRIQYLDVSLDGIQVQGEFHTNPLTASVDISSSGDVYGYTGSFNHLQGNGSEITGVISSSYAITSSYSHYAVSASHEIIKEVSSSYADTASYAESGNGIFSGSFSGSFEGEGSGLTGIPASGITGLNLSRIASGSVTASIAPDKGLEINTNITASGNISSSGEVRGANLYTVGTLTAEHIISTDDMVVTDDLTVNGNISGSNLSQIHASIYKVDSKTFANFSGGTFQLAADAGTTQIDLGKSNAAVPVFINGAVTCSSDISSSGNIYGKDLYVGGSQFTDISAIPNHFGIGLNGWGSLVLANITASGNISSSATSTASFGTYLGDGSQLSGISTTPFPFSGSAIITGSLFVSQSVVDFTSASAVLMNIEDIPLVNPIVEYILTGAITSSGTTITLPNLLTYVSSSTYEYLEIFINGDRLRYNQDFIPTSTSSIQFQISIPSTAEVTYKSLKRPT